MCTGFRSECEHVKHGRVSLVLELRRVDELGLGRSAWPRRDRNILLSANLEGHRRRREAGADVDLPELFERDIVKRCNGAVHQTEENKPPTGRKRTAVVRVLQMHS